MAFLGTTNDNKNVFFCKLQGLKKGSDKVYFEAKRKNEDGNYEIVATPFGLSGNLESIKVEKYQHNGDTYTNFKLKLTTETDAYIVTFGNNSVSRNLLNSLAGTDIIGEVSFGVFIDDNGYKKIWVKNDGERTSWKYTIDELNKYVVKETLKSGKEIIDTSKLELFFEETVVPEIAAKLSPVLSTQPVASQQTEDEEEEDDDLPF